MLSRTTASHSLRRATARHQVSQRLRAGFTMIEILVVIVVISLLLALLVPAIGRGKARVIVARVATDIKQIESSIGSFKGKYGMDPPSQFVIYLNKAGWDSDPAAKGLVRRIWPQFDFRMGGTTDTDSTTGRGVAFPSDWTTTPRQMNCGECLMFFLGGVIDANGSPIGFSKNPLYPFSPTGTNREGPFMEFDIARIRDSDGNMIMEYYDSMPEPHAYLYFSAYEGRGYRLIELPVSGTTYSTIHDVYRTSKSTGTPPAPPTGPTSPPSNTVQTGTSNTLPAHKPQTCQIISAGFDGLYGDGGYYNPDAAGGGLSKNEDHDNITNFTGGQLVN